MPFSLSEERAQDIFTMLLETAAPITRERTVPDPTEDEPDRVKVETYQDARGLGECLRDEITAFIQSIDQRAIDHKRAKAAKAAAEAITDQPGVTVAG